ncbi:hypothetical protein H6771_01015 [Candidatus Peribacteria bacterium]|nr:hypothetical protein [Candidatus Peribacteria bacterium]
MTNRSSSSKGPNVYGEWHKSKGSHVSGAKKRNKAKARLRRAALAQQHGLRCR